MRSHSIILTGTSLKERIELREFLKSKNEPILEQSSAFILKECKTTAQFCYKEVDRKWVVSYNSVNTISIKEFIKKFSTLTQKRNLAFYKESGEPWSVEELKNICKYCGDITTISATDSEQYKRKWVYDDSSSTAFMWMWQEQRFPSNYTCLSYESIFNNSLSDICVGDEYTNSANKLCIIKEIISDNKIRFLHEDGNHYNTSNTTIKRYWTKINPTPEKESIMKPIFAQYIVNKDISYIPSSSEQGVLNSIVWDRTPQGNSYWEETYGKLSSTNKVSTDEEVFKRYAAMTTTTSSELIQSLTNKETFMSKLKSTAITTLDQNKEAAIIASKMEAGRILNKQVLKQLKPHVPMFFRGYLDTPLAPIIAANAIAMLGNHTGNTKIQKLSELMLLGAADATVQSFNLDKIIDDILKGVNLPAGILDADNN